MVTTNNIKENCLPSPEREDNHPTIVDLEIVKAGGFGDIFHGVGLASALNKSPNIETRLHFNRAALSYLPSICRDELEQILAQPEPKDETASHVWITISVPPQELIRSDAVHIHIQDFAKSWSSEEADYIITPGLGFNPRERKRIQAGIIWSPLLAEKLTQRSAIKKQTKRKLAEQLDNFGLPDLSNWIGREKARIGFVYTSSLQTNYRYIKGLAEAVKNLGAEKIGSVIVFFLGSSPCGYRIGAYKNEPIGRKLRQLINSIPISFYDLSDPESLKYDKREESSVICCNLGRSIPHDRFLDLLLTANFPSVITGDLSLSEAIQIANSDRIPPFLYYSYYGKQAQNFVQILAESSNPQAAAIAADYILGENIPQSERDRISATLLSLRRPSMPFWQIFVDQSLQNAYSQAMAQIPLIISEQRRQAGIPLADLLVWEHKAVEFIIRCISARQEEKISLLLPPSYRSE